MLLPQIHITPPVRKKLKKIFSDYTWQSIYNALRFHRNSELAREIRSKAIELKAAELKKDKSYESGVDVQSPGETRASGIHTQPWHKENR